MFMFKINPELNHISSSETFMGYWVTGRKYYRRTGWVEFTQENTYLDTSTWGINEILPMSTIQIKVPSNGSQFPCNYYVTADDNARWYYEKKDNNDGIIFHSSIHDDNRGAIYVIYYTK